MEMGLRGKRLLVAGATGGIGGAICRMRSSEGCSVVVHDLPAKDQANEQLAEDLRRGGGEATVCCADVGQPSDVIALAESAARVARRHRYLGQQFGDDLRSASASLACLAMR
jgi:NAD(P)-dependent dehydrogenase (short-subunit alcohol dehydrogenase family)